MSKEILAGATNQTIDVFIQDSSSTTGAGLTGLAYNTASLTCYYRIGATGTATSLSLATQTVGGAHSDGGFIEIDATNMAGMYRLDLSDAMVATAGLLKIMLQGAADMAPCPIEIEVVSINKYDAVRAGLTALPNAAADAAGGLPISDAGGLDLDTILDAAISTRLASASISLSGGAVTVGTNNDKTGYSVATGGITAASIATGAIDADSLATDAVDEIADGVWDEVLTGATHNVNNSAGRRLRLIDAAFEVHAGTAQAGSTSTTIVMDTGASTVDDIYNGDRVIIVAGTGAQEQGIIIDYVGSTRTATMARSWVVTPDNTSEFAVVPADVDVETWNHSPVTGDGDWSALKAVADGIATVLTGITSLAEWLGIIAGKQTGNSTARTELRATGAGSGTYDETVDSLEAIRDRGDVAWLTATPPTATAIADAVLIRGASNVEDSANAYSLGALLLTSYFGTADADNNQLIVTKTDGATAFNTYTISVDTTGVVITSTSGTV